MFDFLDSENIGKEYKGFVLCSIDDVTDYKAKGVFLRHKRTGLEVYHVIKDDKENMFAFAFRTVSKDSKGTAHIMEHSTLCGSEKYPLKEPFNTLAATSLNTFLNALTYPDKTVYPGASVVRSDYFNMMDVYADSVFFPKLDYTTFIQEGHRLEMDENGKLSIQGVVYNEMKGNYSAFNQIAFSETISAMYPQSYPAFDSGGDPLEIPDLTYEQFLDFHQKFYNPDNCILYLYGDIPTADQLDFINERFIERIEKKYNCTKDVPNYTSDAPILKPEIKELIELKLNTESTEIRRLAPDAGATGEMVNLLWYTGEQNIEKYYLGEVLCGNDSSPMKKLLKESGLGDDDTAGNFGQFKEEFWSFGLMGVKKANEQKLYDIILKGLNEIYKKGVSKEDIDSAVMGIDFNLREVNRWWGPSSMQIMDKVLKDWTYGNKCCHSLDPITSFEGLKLRLKEDPELTQKLIKKYFLDNKVVIKVVVEPSSEYFTKRNKAEAELIAKLEKSLDKEQLKKDLDELHAYQQHVETPEETACIPSTKKEELDRTIDSPRAELQFVKGSDGSDIPLFVSKEETNGLFYFDVLFPFDHIAPKYYRHMNFLSNVITNLGWNHKGWDNCIAESACIMGDVWGKILIGNVNDCPECNEFADKYKQYNFMGRNWLGISAKALTSQAQECLDLMAEIITTMDFDDVKRFKTLAQEQWAEAKANFVSSGRDFAIKRARAGTSYQMALVEILWGITQMDTTKEYTKKAKKTLKIFKQLYEDCVKAGGIIHITADEESLAKILPMMEKFACDAKLTKLLPAGNFQLQDIIRHVSQYQSAFELKGLQAIKVESQTGYSVVASKASRYLSKEAAAEQVFASWFSLHSLWDKIRTTGGAYGASCWVDNGEKSIIYSSYRDPSPEKTIKVYADALKDVMDNPIPKDDIDKTIVSTYGGAIVPVTPKDRGERGFNAFIYGEPEYSRQRRVDNILNVTPEDIEKTVKRLYENAQQEYRQVVFCDKKVDISGKKLKLPL